MKNFDGLTQIVGLVVFVVGCATVYPAYLNWKNFQKHRNDTYFLRRIPVLHNDWLWLAYFHIYIVTTFSMFELFGVLDGFNGEISLFAIVVFSTAHAYIIIIKMWACFTRIRLIQDTSEWRKALDPQYNTWALKHYKKIGNKKLLLVVGILLYLFTIAGLTYFIFFTDVTFSSLNSSHVQDDVDEKYDTLLSQCERMILFEIPFWIILSIFGIIIVYNILLFNDEWHMKREFSLYGIGALIAIVFIACASTLKMLDIIGLTSALAIVFLGIQLTMIYLVFISTTWVIFVNDKNYRISMTKISNRLHSHRDISHTGREMSRSVTTDQSMTKSAGTATKMLKTLSTDEG